jgi:hypothetical protein
VKFFARTIVAAAQQGTLKMGVTDFSRARIIAPRARTSVEFEAGISREDAIAALTAWPSIDCSLFDAMVIVCESSAQSNGLGNMSTSG